jgi:hypothetical protein
MPKIYLHETELAIINESIKLCELLSLFSELSHQQAELIRNVQVKLLKLPFVETTVDCGVGLSIIHGNDDGGLERSWNIGLANYQNPDKHGSLEIFSLYNPSPMPHENESFIDMVGHESYMTWLVDKVRDDLAPYSGEDWIREVNNLDQFFKMGDSLMIEIYNQNIHYEIDCTASFMKLNEVTAVAN